MPLFPQTISWFLRHIPNLSEHRSPLHNCLLYSPSPSRAILRAQQDKKKPSDKTDNWILWNEGKSALKGDKDAICCRKWGRGRSNVHQNWEEGHLWNRFAGWRRRKTALHASASRRRWCFAILQSFKWCCKKADQFRNYHFLQKGKKWLHNWSVWQGDVSIHHVIFMAAIEPRRALSTNFVDRFFVVNKSLYLCVYIRLELKELVLLSSASSLQLQDRSTRYKMLEKPSSKEPVDHRSRWVVFFREEKNTSSMKPKIKRPRPISTKPSSVG